MYPAREGTAPLSIEFLARPQARAELLARETRTVNRPGYRLADSGLAPGRRRRLASKKFLGRGSREARVRSYFSFFLLSGVTLTIASRREWKGKAAGRHLGKDFLYVLTHATRSIRDLVAISAATFGRRAKRGAVPSRADTGAARRGVSSSSFPL